ncbi:MAG: alanine racemase [Candidatus Aminicenantes bacterium]|nr:alanine racemase [Candidatus Aminicenantes bacterium]
MKGGGGRAGLAQWVEVSRKALTHNLAEFRRRVGRDRKLLAVVKANAYGHGILEVSRIAIGAGADWLGVNSLEEGIELRRAGVRTPILVLGYVPLGRLGDAVARGLRLTVYNKASVDGLAAACRRLKKKARVHVKVEPGTNRQGVLEGELPAFARSIQRRPGLVLEGLSSHFANIEDTTDHSFPQRQLAAFERSVRGLEKAGIEVPITHMSCTAATILFPETYFDMVRVGIGLYGLWPSKETYLSCALDKREPLTLEPVLTWKARIAQVKRIAKGGAVGYGCTFRATRRTTLAVIPVGYYDGYDRGLSNTAHVLVRGQRAPLRGRVAMNFSTADVTDIPGVGIEDEVVLLGADGRERITAEQLAALAGTISHEIVARINPLVPRIVV